jgi:hypothetical protein
VPDLDDARQPGAPDEAALAVVARHALHDEELVAALAAGALDGEEDADERARARSFVERCPTCRAVHDDLAAIGGALHAAAAFSAAAPRDFRLTLDDAHRLGGTVVSRRVAGGIRAMLLGLARPVGASMAALGLVGVFVGSAVLGSAGLAGAPAVDLGSTTGGAELSTGAPAAAPTFEIANGPGTPPEASERTAYQQGEPDDGRQAVAPGGATWLLGLSMVAVVAGLAVFVIGVRANRGRAPGRGPR